MFNKEVILEQSKLYDSFYIYDESVILKSIKELKENFEGIDFIYSLKTNPATQVCKTIYNKNIGADAASAREVIFSSEMGVSKEDIQYSAPAKTKKDIEQTVELSTIIADSINEVYLINEVAKDKGLNVNIGLRVNPNFSFDGLSGGPSKFGIDEDEIFKCLEDFKALSNLKVKGIHIHLRSQELNNDVIKGYYSKILDLAKRVSIALGENLEFVNMGSGIGIPYATSDVAVDVVTLGNDTKALVKDLRESLGNVRVIIETGRYLAGKSGNYVTKVLDIKKSMGTTFVMLNNTLNGFIRPSLVQLIVPYSDGGELKGSEPLFTSKNAFNATVLTDEKEKEIVTLAGNLCTATDVVLKNIELPVMKRGDIVVIDNAGSYAAVLSPMQFSWQTPPEQLFLTVNGEIVKAY